MHWSCHLLGPKTITFQKGSCGAFRLMWSRGWGGYCARQCGRMLRARWECVFACKCVCVCVHARAGVRVTWQEHISQRAAGPDVWLPLTARSRRGWSGEGPAPSAPPPHPSVPRDKSQGPLDRCEFSGFCAQSPETCRVRNLTFAGSRIVFLNPSCCLRHFGGKE